MPPIVQALANYFSPMSGFGAYHRDVPASPISGFGCVGLGCPSMSASSEEGDSVGLFGLAIQAAAGYYVGTKMAAPIWGAALGALFGMPGIFALALFKPAVAVANKRRRRSRKARRSR